jgi:hypothetical protein
MASTRAPLGQLIREIVRDLPEPLPIEGVAALLAERAPAASKDPPGSVRNHLANNPQSSVVKLIDGRIGWKPRLISGATHRHALYEEDLAEQVLPLDPAVLDLLYPSLLDRARDPGSEDLQLELAGGTLSEAKVSYSEDLQLELAGGTLSEAKVSYGDDGWELVVDAPFWEWLERMGAEADDHLIITALDGQARRYGVRLERADERDEAAIEARNRALLAAAEALFERRRDSYLPDWQLFSALNANGFFHDPVPPAAYDDLWMDDAFGPDELGFDTAGFESLTLTLPPGMSEQQVTRRLEELLRSPTPPRLAADDPLVPLLNQIVTSTGLPVRFGIDEEGTATLLPLEGAQRPKASELLGALGGSEADRDFILEGAGLGLVSLDQAFLDGDAEAVHPPDLPRAYTPARGERKAQPSPTGKRGPVQTYLLRVSYRGMPDSYREIEIAEDQNFEDLHLMIQKAFDWDDDHLYSFFMGRRPYDKATEIGSPWSECKRHTHQVTLGGIGLKIKQRFLYLFDYGDDHLFDLEVRAINPQAPKGKYPKIVASHGPAPSQYGDWDDEDEEE